MPAPPLTVIGGYLGVGKTTLINQLLRQSAGRRIAVLVNDFGAVNIDADLIESHDGNVVRLAGGCVCCAFGADLVAGLQAVLPTLPDHILVESSGVGSPGSIARTAAMTSLVRTPRVLVVADARNVQARLQDPFVGDTVQRQLADADRMALSHCDELAAGEVLARVDWLAALHPDTVTVPVIDGSVDPAFVFDACVAAGRAVPPGRVASDAAQLHPFTAAVYTSVGRLNVSALANALAALQPTLARAKGILQDEAGGLVTLQVAESDASVQPCVTAANATPVVCIGVVGRYDAAAVRRVFGQFGLH